MLRLPTEGDGVLIFDDTGFANRAASPSASPVSYSGTRGKTGNCQVAVNCLPLYTARTIAWPVATRLYLPQQWAETPTVARRPRCLEEVTFRTKPEIALGLLDQTWAWNVRHACMVADADCGDYPNFLASLERC